MNVPIGPREFTTTHWSLITAAQTDEQSQTIARKALEELCRAYWYPLYAFVRNRGYAPEDAQDLTQAFLARFIETGGFASADRRRGRFRSYLLGALKHFLANDWRRGQTRKRGGDVVFLAWDSLDPEAKYGLEPASTSNPETEFDREWARQLTARALAKLNAEAKSSGKPELFETIQGCLTGEELDRVECEKKLGMTEGAVKAAIYRLRQRYRDCVRAEIAETVGEAAEVDDEMRHLLAVLRKA